MSLKKKYLKSKPYCDVTFCLSKHKIGPAEKVTVAGEFNEWKTDQTPLKAQKNGDYAVTLPLKSGRDYQYRFVVDGHKWITDDCADKYASAGIGAELNSVVVLEKRP